MNNFRVFKQHLTENPGTLVFILKLFSIRIQSIINRLDQEINRIGYRGTNLKPNYYHYYYHILAFVPLYSNRIIVWSKRMMIDWIRIEKSFKMNTNVPGFSIEKSKIWPKYAYFFTKTLITLARMVRFTNFNHQNDQND